ncbi:MAG: hypothetical protein ABH811_00655 [archaeon]
MKKILIILFGIIFLSSLIIAQEYKMEISTIPKDKIFEPGQTIQIKVTLQDINNKIIEDDVLIILEDLKGVKIKETTIKSANFAKIVLDKNIIAGEGKMIANYKGTEISESFFVGKNELAEFKLDGEKLIITNTGNTIYEKKIYITIGDTIGTKTPRLGIGESISYRLIAPEGVYNIQIKEDGTTSPILEVNDVPLTGKGLTGKAVGVLDESTGGASRGITGISPDPDSEGELFSYIKTSKFVYVFVFVVFGAMILLAIERRYRKN